MNVSPKTQNLALIGYRGTGKSHTAGKLAARLGWNWLDADEELERRAGCTIAEIFSGQGEQAFRNLESEILTELVRKPQTVLALGGGVVLRPANRQLLAQVGSVVWLQASPATLVARLAADATTASRRPQLTVQGGLAEIEQLLAERSPWYQACAAFAVNTEQRTAEQVVEAIIAQLPAELLDPA